jgi:monoamine oxidase
MLQRHVDAGVRPSARARALDLQSVAEWQRGRLRSVEARELFDIVVRAVFCASPEQLSLLHFLTVLRANGSFYELIDVEGGAQERVVQGGMHQLAVYLARQLQQPVLLDAPVLSIEQSPRDVAVRHAKGELHARRVVVAMAPPMARKIRMTPTCDARDRLGERMPMGSVIKCLAAYERPFWRSRGLSGEFVSDKAPLSPTFDASPADGSCGILVGFVSGPDAVRLSGNPDARRGEVVASLVTAFGPEAAHPVDYIDHDWIADPWSEGCYLGLPTPGTLTELGPALREAHGRVHWAGTETSEIWTGYIEGALCSGERVAREVMHAAR